MEQVSNKTAYPKSDLRSGASLFLLELIIAIGFFAVAGIVCINMFLHSHRVSVAAGQKTEAVRISQNCAESFIAADGDKESFLELLEAAFPEDSVSESGTDEILLISGEGGYETRIGITCPADGKGMAVMQVRVGSAEDKELFELEVKDYAVPQVKGVTAEGGGHEQ